MSDTAGGPGSGAFSLRPARPIGRARPRAPEPVVVSPEELAAQLESMRGELTAATERIDSLEAELVAVRETLEEMRRTRSSLSFTAPLQAFEEALRGDQPPPDETHWVADG